MRQELTAEIVAPRAEVWQALENDLAARGAHVELLGQQPPRSLRLRVRSSALESLTLGYDLAELDPGHTTVRASIEPSGALYFAKRLFSFGAVEKGYLAAIAAGLQNLQEHFERPLKATDEGATVTGD